MADILKITDPNKIVTDSVLLSALAKQGIDKDYVEFFQDYASRNLGKEHSPYAKFYRDLKSNKRFMVVSGLPMVDGDGVKIECGWRGAGLNYFSEKNNLFRAKVQGTEVELIVRNDQPDGRKANDRLSYKPQLFLNGVPFVPGASTLLPIDPVNSNYLENTLEWDYGICKRRLRIIEGSILGNWVFASKPNGEVRIKYNQTGDFRLRLGQFGISDDEEVIKPEDFDLPAQFGGYPITISDSLTVYPDTNAAGVDGWAARIDVDEAWATIRAGAGNGNDYTATSADIWLTVGGASQNQYQLLSRIIIVEDTSGLPDTAIISAATQSVYGKAKTDGLSTTPDMNLYTSTPGSETVLANSDYGQTGATAKSTAITYNNFQIGTPGTSNDFALNDLTIISLTGRTKLALRNANRDVANSAPNWVEAAQSGLTIWTAEQGTGYKPKLVVTYTVAGWTHIAKVNGVASAAIAKVNGVAVAAIAKINGVAV